jgi:Ala-tRNA(Pro) deacylase
VKNILGAEHVRLATEQEMERIFSECEVGAIPPLRHWKNVEVIMDIAMDVAGDILIQAGTHHDAIRLNFKDWYEMVQPRVESFSELLELAHA